MPKTPSDKKARERKERRQQAAKASQPKPAPAPAAKPWPHIVELQLPALPFSSSARAFTWVEVPPNAGGVVVRIDVPCSPAEVVDRLRDLADRIEKAMTVNAVPPDQ